MARSNAQKRADATVSSSTSTGTDKIAKTTSVASSSTTTTTTTTANASSIPAPFEPAPDLLQSWLAHLPRDRLYLTHLDLNPRALKRQVFFVPVVLNVLFASLVVWRIYYIWPWYAQVAQQIWQLCDVGSWGRLFSGHGSVVGLIKHELRNCVTVAIDYLLLLIVAPWPWSFFLEQPGNPVSWRWSVGFRERELVVRMSRGWDVDDLMHGSAKQASESPFFVTRVFPAVQMERLSKTGYLLMDKDWDLDFWAMTLGQRSELDGAAAADAKQKEDKDKTALKEMEAAFNGKLFAYWKPSAASPDSSGQWAMWDFRRDLFDKEQAASSTEGLDGLANGERSAGEVTEGRRAIERFQAKLAEMGKEELFFKWVELIHYESSKPGGFTKQRQIEAGAKIKQLFEQYEVDFEKFERDCGIVDGRIVD